MDVAASDQQEREGRTDRDADVEAFLSRDYEIKVRYYSDHMGRVWTRFNFFITLQSGLLAGLVFARDTGEFTSSAVYFLIAEAVLSLVWYVFGAQDRYLIADYRRHIEKALESLRARGVSIPDDYPYAGKVEVEKDRPFQRRSLVEWRWEPISITRLPAVVPLVFLVFWLVMIVLHES
jgi:hypothetical protein